MQIWINIIVRLLSMKIISLSIMIIIYATLAILIKITMMTIRRMQAEIWGTSMEVCNFFFSLSLPPWPQRTLTVQEYGRTCDVIIYTQMKLYIVFLFHWIRANPEISSHCVYGLYERSFPPSYGSWCTEYLTWRLFLVKNSQQ